MNSDENANKRLEYEAIHQTRINWTNTMNRWRQIVIPIALSLVPLSGLANWDYWGIGWLTGSILLVLWLIIDGRIDKEIVRLYPRILELEKELDIRFYSHYLYLNRDIKNKDIKKIEEYNPDGKYNYDELINIANVHKENFVGYRGRLTYLYFFWLYLLLGFVALCIYSAN